MRTIEPCARSHSAGAPSLDLVILPDAIASLTHCDCGQRPAAPTRCSGPVERLRKFEHALGRRVPAFRRMRVVVQVAAHAHETVALREGEVPAHGRAGYVGVEF